MDPSPRRGNRQGRSRIVLLVASTLLAACSQGAAGSGSPSPVPSTSAGLPTVSVEPSATASVAPATPPAGLPGGWLMFSRFDESIHTFLSTHVIRPDGTGEVELTLPGPEGGGSFSRDGSRIAIMTVMPDERIGTAIIEPDGTVDRVFELPDPTLNLVCTVWSTDDERLACEGWDDTDPSRTGVYTVLASDGSDLQRISTPADGINDLPGDFSPDGGSVLFLRAAGEAEGQIMLADLDGEGLRPFAEGGFDIAGEFSPAGDTLLTSSGGRLMLLDLEGNVLTTIEHPKAFLFGAVWSPDGEWIAYSRTVGGFIADVYISRPDGSNVWQVTGTPANEIEVRWGPDPT